MILSILIAIVIFINLLLLLKFWSSGASSITKILGTLLTILVYIPDPGARIDEILLGILVFIYPSNTAKLLVLWDFIVWLLRGLNP